MEDSNGPARIVDEWMSGRIFHGEELLVESINKLCEQGKADVISRLYDHQVKADSELAPIRSNLCNAYRGGEPSEKVWEHVNALRAKEKSLPFSAGAMSAAKKALAAIREKEKIRA